MIKSLGMNHISIIFAKSFNIFRCQKRSWFSWISIYLKIVFLRNGLSLKWDQTFSMYSKFYKELKFLTSLKRTRTRTYQGLCIPIRGNSVYILFISSKRLGIFKLNFDTLIICSVETFSHHYTEKLKRLRIHNLRLLFYTYYMKISWHVSLWNLHWGYPLKNWVTRWRHECGHVTAWNFLRCM